ncbi:MAG: hypothetical protein K0U59_03975 [Gammaproteobacteria bacterium]|nr:hypothetical protein [Gammaproteobacteria bacterium]
MLFYCQTSASGFDAAVVGRLAEESGDNAVALAINSLVSGVSSLAVGAGSIVSGCRLNNHEGSPSFAGEAVKV